MSAAPPATNGHRPIARIPFARDEGAMPSRDPVDAAFTAFKAALAGGGGPAAVTVTLPDGGELVMRYTPHAAPADAPPPARRSKLGGPRGPWAALFLDAVLRAFGASK